jgi:D-sedoheptulose 7-phosphate isomerase
MQSSRLRTVAIEHERVGHEHLAAVSRALDAFVDQLPRLEEWGRRLAATLLGGGRLLAVGNGGSAAQAQHLTSELVGRYRGERVPLSAISLHAETSTVTALLNDYGADEVFARQVRAHGRRHDILLAISTSGRSANVIAAVDAAHELGMTAWALTAGQLSSLECCCDESVTVQSLSTATIQEVHQIAIHILCEALDQEVAALESLHAPRALRSTAQ